MEYLGRRAFMFMSYDAKVGFERRAYIKYRLFLNAKQ